MGYCEKKDFAFSPADLDKIKKGFPDMHPIQIPVDDVESGDSILVKIIDGYLSEQGFRKHFRADKIQTFLCPVVSAKKYADFYSITTRFPDRVRAFPLDSGEKVWCVKKNPSQLPLI